MGKPKRDKNIEIPDYILKYILTPSELRMLKNRWQIIECLEEGLSIRKTAERVKVGTDTIVRVARMIEKSSMRKILDKEMVQTRQFKSRTPWIFGKNK